MSQRFNWQNFITFSKKLLQYYQNFSNIEEETTFRVVCSRAYYGAFKPFEDKIKDNNTSLPEYDNTGRKLGSHDKIIFYITNNINRNIGRKLKRLKTLRVNSDYWADRKILMRDSQEAIELAEKIYNFYKNYYQV